MAFALRGGAFLFEGFDRGGFGQAVQRHVDERGVAAASGSTGRGLEAFPLGAAGFIDVNVGVNEAGENAIVSAVDYPIAMWNASAVTDGCYTLIINQYRSRTDAFGKNHSG